MSVELDQAKAAVRARLRAAVAGLAPEAKAAASARLCARVLASMPWRTARAVLLFCPLPDEPDVRPLIEAAWGAGKRVALPRFRGGTTPAASGASAPGGVYEAGLVEQGWAGLRPGRFGILEPAPEASTVSLNQLDLVLVPGVGFAPDGSRLGRGRGFYDRLLASASGLKCGAGFDEQMVAELPVGAHDIHLDCILTPSRGWSAGRRVVLE